MKKISLFVTVLFMTSLSYGSNTVLIDQYYSPFMGSQDLLAVQQLMIDGEDYLFPKKESQPNTYWHIFGRGLEEYFIWNQVDMLAAVTQHEVFGHGYRLRELGETPAGYYITPWGGGTRWEYNGALAVGKVTAVSVAGLEAEAIMARDMKMQWMRDGVIDGRLAPTYTQVAQSVFWYTLVTHLGKTESNGLVGNDVSSYIYLLNATYGNNKYNHSSLMKMALYNLIDPMTFYAYISMFYYIGTGETSWKFPMFTIRNNIQYLPNIRIGYAPYAPEAYFENFFVINHEPVYVYVKGSGKSLGVGAAFDNIWFYSKGAIGFRVDGWHQNKFITSATLDDLDATGTAYRPTLKERIWGGALSVTGTMKVSQKLKLYGEIGGKSAGYLPGYPLEAAAIGRLGLRF